jgi:hypothetical protein
MTDAKILAWMAERDKRFGEQEQIREATRLLYPDAIRNVATAARSLNGKFDQEVGLAFSWVPSALALGTSSARFEGLNRGDAEGFDVHIKAAPEHVVKQHKIVPKILVEVGDVKILKWASNTVPEVVDGEELIIWVAERLIEAQRTTPPERFF